MVFLIPKSLVKIYENWDIRGGILLSFSLQVFLVLFTPLRKRSNSILVGSFIWFAYLLADWAPSFSVGQIFTDNFGDVKNTNSSSSKNNLMAFWAPFLLLHFGGPDTITALALEDNRLWPRQIPILVVQLVASAYIFILTLPGNTLWIPTVLIFIAGTIKYIERILALYHASKLPFKLQGILDLLYKRFPTIKSLRLDLNQSDALTDAEISGEEMEAVTGKAPEEALRMIEVQLELLYEMFYTKATVLHNKIGFLFRFVAFSFIVVALGVFTSLERNDSDKFNKIDVIVTYILLYGAVCLDAVSLVKLVFSEGTIAASANNESQENSFKGHLYKFYKANVKLVLSLRRQRWSKCKKDPYTKFQALSTPLLFRKWCGSIPRHNLIRYCLCHPENHVLKCAFTTLYKVAECFGSKELLEMSLYTVNSSFLLELWQFIFNELIITRTIAAWGGQQFAYTKIFQYALQRAELNAESMKEFIDYVDWLWGREQRENLCFDELIILWHIATDLCYADESDDFEGVDERQFSKLLSDYMLYLLIMQPNMLSEVAVQTDARGILEEIFNEASKFFRDHKEYFILRKEEKKEIVACRCLLSEPMVGYFKSVEDENERSGASKLSLARDTAHQLQQLQDKKWKFIGIAWVQMLLFAAYNSKLSSHVEQLPKGGELISLVWLFIWEHLQVRTFIVE